MPEKHYPHIISISNQKGGVGKTTLTRELGIYLASLINGPASVAGNRVLLIDCDPQANLTKSLVDEEILNGSGPAGLYEAISGGCYELLEISPYFGNREGGLKILCGSIRLAALEKMLLGELDAYTRLKELLSTETFRLFDYILIDTPPSFGVLTINALASASHVLMPMNPAIYSMQGTNDLMETVTKVRRNLNPSLNLLGVVINAFDMHPLIAREIYNEISASFGEKVFNTVLSRSVKVEEAIAARSSLMQMKSKLKGEIERIGMELVARIGEI